MGVIGREESHVYIDGKMEGKKMKNEKIYTCKRLRMYDWLSMRGWKPIRRETDLMNANYINWVYERTPEFDADVNLYFEWLKTRR